MKPSRGFLTWRLSAALFACSLAVFVPTASVQADHCQLFAGQPEYLNASIQGEGSWTHCPSTAHVEVLLRKDIRWWWDSTLRETTGSGSSGGVNLAWPCGSGFSPTKVYVETRYGSKKVQSARATLAC
jgi:hypothetical protein